MKNIIEYIQRKLSVKLSLGVVVFAAVIFLAALGFLFMQSREAVRQVRSMAATAIHTVLTIQRTAAGTVGPVTATEGVPSEVKYWLKGTVISNSGALNLLISF